MIPEWRKLKGWFRESETYLAYKQGQENERNRIIDIILRACDGRGGHGEPPQRSGSDIVEIIKKESR